MWRRRCELRGYELRRGWRRCVSVLESTRGGAALVDDLIEAAVEPRQRIGDAVGALVGAAGDATRLRFRLRHAFELPGQGIETLIDGGKVIATGVLVVVRTPI